MDARKEIEKKIRQKEEEVRSLQQNLYSATAYIEALRESLRLISRSADGSASESLREGSLVDMARSFLKKSGKPLHVDKILVGIGKEVTKKNKVSLSGSLAQYVRQGNIFTRPAPNTFGLKDFEETGKDDLPEEFGTL